LEEEKQLKERENIAMDKHKFVPDATNIFL
jgi:hypothetical protein